MNEYAASRMVPRTPRELWALGLASPKPQAPSLASIEPVDLPPEVLPPVPQSASRANRSNEKKKSIADELINGLRNEFDRLEKLNDKLWLENKSLQHRLDGAQTFKAQHSDRVVRSDMSEGRHDISSNVAKDRDQGKPRTSKASVVSDDCRPTASSSLSPHGAPWATGGTISQPVTMLVENEKDSHDVDTVSSNSDGVDFDEGRIIGLWENLFLGLCTRTRSRFTIRREFSTCLDKIPSSARSIQDWAGDVLRRQQRRFTVFVDIRQNGCNVVIVPGSRTYFIWTLCALMFVLHDVIFAPIWACFDGTDGSSSVIIAWISWLARIFWTCHMCLSFVTGIYVKGVLITDLRQIILAYIRTWFIFDLVLVLVDWLWWLLSPEFREPQGQIARACQLVRLLRLRRFWDKAEVLLGVFFSFFPSLLLYGGVIKMTLSCLAWNHVVACLWHGLGRARNDGWAKSRASTFWENYATSSHWAMTQIHGTNSVHPRNFVEHVFTSISLLIGLLLLCVLIAQTTHATSQTADMRTLQARGSWQRYTKTHALSSALATRVQRFLRRYKEQRNVADQMRQNTELLSAFPRVLRADILEEVRTPPLIKIVFFRHLRMAGLPILRQLCEKAMVEVQCFDGEIVFAKGDPCQRVLLIQSGSLSYSCREEVIRPLINPAIVISDLFMSMSGTGSGKTNGRSSGIRVLEELASGQHVCEGALWTVWFHFGSLASVGESTLLALEVLSFLEVLQNREHSDALLLAAICAKNWVAELCRAKSVSDLFSFDGDIFYCAEECTDSETRAAPVNKFAHFIFLSHYKQEAGTEATLMQDQLQRMLRNRNHELSWKMLAPVFLDSEDLTDLKSLKMHVESTTNLVLLLTPGVLSRPWCLVELVTAYESGVNIMPVEIQRPGANFKYPDETFYIELRQGHLLDSGARRLLSKERVSLHRLEIVLKHVFSQIALPFSPHKSQNIRQAELTDILKRCAANRRSAKSREVHTAQSPHAGSCSIGLYAANSA